MKSGGKLEERTVLCNKSYMLVYYWVKHASTAVARARACNSCPAHLLQGLAGVVVFPPWQMTTPRYIPTPSCFTLTPTTLPSHPNNLPDKEACSVMEDTNLGFSKQESVQSSGQDKHTMH